MCLLLIVLLIAAFQAIPVLRLSIECLQVHILSGSDCGGRERETEMLRQGSEGQKTGQRIRSFSYVVNPSRKRDLLWVMSI